MATGTACTTLPCPPLPAPTALTEKNHKATCRVTIKKVWIFYNSGLPQLQKVRVRKKTTIRSMGTVRDGVRFTTIDSRSSILNPIIAGVNYKSSSPPGDI